MTVEINSILLSKKRNCHCIVKAATDTGKGVMFDCYYPGSDQWGRYYEDRLSDPSQFKLVLHGNSSLESIVLELDKVL